MMEHALHPPLPPPAPTRRASRFPLESTEWRFVDKARGPEDGDNGEEEREEDVGGKEEEGEGGSDAGREGKGGRRGKWRRAK